MFEYVVVIYLVKFSVIVILVVLLSILAGIIKR